MTRKEIEKLADERYPTAKDVDSSLTTISEREGWIAGFEAGRQSVVDNLLDLKWEDEYAWHFAMALGVKYSINENDGKFILYANRAFVGKLNSLEQAKRVAFFNYKNRIEKALGL